MRWAIALPRLAVLAPLAAALVLLASTSSLLRLLPLPRATALAWLSGAVALALVPALLARASPLPHALAVTVPALAAASYEQSRLDWLRVLKDYGVAAPGDPDLLRLALGLACLLLAWTLHAVDGAVRLRLSTLSRGFAPGEARRAAGVILARSALAAGIATLGAAALGALAWFARGLDVGALLAGRASLLAPIVAAALVVVGAAVLWLAGPGAARKGS